MKKPQNVKQEKILPMHKYLLLFISVRELIQDIRFYDLLNEYRVDFRCVDFPWFCRENLQLIKAVMLYEKLSS